MSKFLLRMPTRTDMDIFRKALPEAEHHKLSLPEHKSFHMSDDPNNKFYSGFRPVLEAIDDTVTECIRDGTSLYLGDCALVDLRLGDKEKPVHWLKCGRLLLAEDCTADSVSFSHLASNGLVKGIEVDMPFEQAVTKMFFDQAVHQPDSALRQIADIMWNLRVETEAKGQGIALPNEELYDIAQKVHHCWNSRDDKSMFDIMQSAADMLNYGLYVIWFDNSRLQSHKFFPETWRNVFATCEQETFNELIDMVYLDRPFERFEHAQLSKKGKVLETLQEAEATCKSFSHEKQNQKEPLENVIKDAFSRIGTTSKEEKPSAIVR